MFRLHIYLCVLFAAFLSHQVFANWWECEEALKGDRVGDFFQISYKDKNGANRTTFAKLVHTKQGEAVFRKSLLTDHEVHGFEYHGDFFTLKSPEIVKSRPYGTDEISFKYDLLASLEQGTLISLDIVSGNSFKRLVGQISSVNSGNVEMTIDDRLVTVPMRNIRASSIRALMAGYATANGNRSSFEYRQEGATNLRKELGALAPSKDVSFKVRLKDGRSLHLLQLPKGCIKQLGWKYILDDGSDSDRCTNDATFENLLPKTIEVLRDEDILESYFTDLNKENGVGEVGKNLRPGEIFRYGSYPPGRIYFEVGSRAYGVDSYFIRFEKTKAGESYVVVREIEEGWSERRAGSVVKIRLKDIVAESVTEGRYEPYEH